MEKQASISSTPFRSRSAEAEVRCAIAEIDSTVPVPRERMMMLAGSTSVSTNDPFRGSIRTQDGLWLWSRITSSPRS
jgi:hypothetical protein